MSLRWRLALLLGGAVAVSVAAVAIAADLSARHELIQGVDSVLVDRTVRVGREPASMAELLDLVHNNPGLGRLPPFVQPDTVLQVISPDGRVLFTTASTPLPVSPEDRQLASSRSATVLLRTATVNGTPFRIATRPLPSVGALQLARDVSDVEATLARLRTRLLLLGAVGVALATAAGWLMARRTVRPVEALTGAAERVATTQRLDARIDVARHDEVGRLASSFNTMLDALATSRHQQRNLVSDAGHELRTPLTSLRTNLEVLRRRPSLPEAERGVLVSGALDEVEELSVLVGELVDLATDSARSEEQTVTAPLRELVGPVVDRARRRTGRAIDVSGTGAAVTVRPTQFERALSNLLDNANKWGPAGTAVDVTIDGTTVDVRDRGPGIDEADLPHVFDRFWRATQARTLPGSGLGLAIVKHTIEGHDGSVHARNAPDGGAVVGFTLPSAS